MNSYVCIDTPSSSSMSDKQIQAIVQEKLKSQGLSGKLSAAKVQKVESSAFSKLKAAFKVSSIWNPEIDPEIRIAFLDGNDHQKQFVEKIVTEHISPLLTKLKFVWNAPNPHIRISFKLKGQAWSAVGTDCKSAPPTDPTMNLGWLDDDIQFAGEEYKNTGQVVLHEFGHALGMIHEHSNPSNNPIVWNKEVVYAALSGPPNRWGKEQIDLNIFEKYGDAEKCEAAKKAINPNPIDISSACSGTLVNGSKYDKDSIMHYWYPQTWIKSGPQLSRNVKLSSMDKEWIRKYYGDPSITEKVVDAVTEEVKKIASSDTIFSKSVEEAKKLLEGPDTTPEIAASSLDTLGSDTNTPEGLRAMLSQVSTIIKSKCSSTSSVSGKYLYLAITWVLASVCVAILAYSVLAK